MNKYEMLNDNKGVFFESIIEGHVIKCRLIEGQDGLSDFYFNMENFEEFKKVLLGHHNTWMLEIQADMANALNISLDDFRFDIICNDVCIYPNCGIDWCAIDHVINDYRHDYKGDLDWQPL